MLQHLKPSTENLADLAETSDIESWQATWQKSEFTATTDVSVKVKTYSDSIRSKHVDRVYLDDVLSNNMGKGAEKDVFYSVLSPIVENSGGLLQIVGTPIEYNDLMMELMDKENFYTGRYRAYDKESEEVLWPAQWTYESLMEKKQEIGPARFAREYMTEPMSVDEQFFDEELIDSALDHDRGAWRRNPHSSVQENWDHFLGVDIALSDGPDADFTVFTCLGRGPDGQTFLVNMERAKGVSPSDIADKIESWDNFYHFDDGLVEKNAIGEGVWKTIEEETKAGMRVRSFDTTRKTRPEILSSLQAGLGRGELKLHGFEPLLREMRGFHMNGKGKLVGREHDDTVMSLAIAYRCVDDGGGSSASLSVVGRGSGGASGDESGGDEASAPALGFGGGEDSDLELGIV